MNGSYRQCVECGKRALKFATRCPGCGIELPNPAPLEGEATRQLTWSHSFKAVMAVLVLGVAIASLERIPPGPAPLSAETPFVKPVIAKKPDAKKPDMVEALAAVAGLPAATPRVDTTVAIAPAASDPSVQLIAKAWTHVRSRRTANATLEAVLTPGDTVTADSLSNGWYRVALYGDVLGYARQATLAPIK